MKRYFEDFEIGETWQSTPVTMTEAEIIDYAKAYDPQPIHTDPEAAANGRFGSVIASGWQVAALSMRLFVESGGYGDTPVVGMGIESLRWRRPVRPGDTLTVTREVIGLERSEKRPEWGTIRTQVSMANQDGEVVMTLVSLGQVACRSKA
ncbi:MaoC family dehydratase [Mameliella alba]|uniref:MaoC family dehydratase n=1 Tax=Mameliella TaxID=1434019 RepID=UPI000B5346A0|nr:MULTISPECIES: MaoC family dehydratase [Mameliella]MBV6637243.1 MaoC family dehydratase [Mameliella sp.]MBY6120299.1 MaoC family dehydratase [Mameliella alba]OWV53691.1 enoyl-CoA hydratase [Mameliella alba]OWV60667.1 enoyl-CoA hydratase [Mameliella alba]